jgi:flagellar motor switch protein FliM
MSRRIRKLVFGVRSALPASAACVVGNGVREALTSLLGVPIEMRIFEPTIPAARTWNAIVEEALLYRVRGKVADAAIVLRSGDAIGLAAALFGENTQSRDERKLSPIEREVLDRTVNVIAAQLGSVCGTPEKQSIEVVDAIAGFSTYFELFLEAPLGVRIGIALSREPSPEPRALFDASHLAAVRIATHATLDLGALASGAVARLVPGAIVGVGTTDLHRGLLNAYGRPLARGIYGLINGRGALRVESVAESA